MHEFGESGDAELELRQIVGIHLRFEGEKQLVHLRDKISVFDSVTEQVLQIGVVSLTKLLQE